MKLTPYRLVTLLEILETSAEAFWRLSGLLGQLIIRLENHQIDESNIGAVASSLGELMREAERLNLRMAVQQLERIKEQLIGERRGTLASVGPMLVDLHLRILDTLEDAVFLIVPPECKELYRQSKPPVPCSGAPNGCGFPSYEGDGNRQPKTRRQAWRSVRVRKELAKYS